MSNNRHQTPAWKVLLIGGHSGAGKTVVARQLARRYGLGLSEVDDVRLVLQRMTPPEQQPGLHFFVGADLHQWSMPELVARLVTVNEHVCSALEIVVANHVATDTALILEGDGILPAFAAQARFADLQVGQAVRSVFIMEQDRTQLFGNMQRRGRGFDTFGASEQQRWVELSWRYGQWLAAQARQHSVPLVAARPWATLAARIRTATMP